MSDNWINPIDLIKLAVDTVKSKTTTEAERVELIQSLMLKMYAEGKRVVLAGESYEQIGG